MKNKSFISPFSGILLGLIFLSASAFQTNTTTTTASDAKSLQLIKALEKVNGGWSKLAKLKDVEFTYDYNDLGKKAKDVSVERYIFDGEASWAEYSVHEVNAMPGVAGTLKQCLMEGKPEASLDGKPVNDPQVIGGTAFLRSANFYWFTMMYKLGDPGTNHKYLGTEVFNGITYDKVSLTYNSVEVNKEVNDEYILYFNPKTHLVDLFYFSLPAMGVNQPVLRMELDYEKIKGVYIATKRRGVFPNAQGEYTLGGEYTSSNIKFKNGFTKKDFAL